MNILYVSSLCSDKKFVQIFTSSKIKPGQQSQKFHKLLTRGFKNLNNDIYVMTALPISRLASDKTWFPTQKEKEMNIEYHYLPFVNYPIFRHVFIFLASFFSCIVWNIKNRKKEKVIFCDVLSLTNSVAAFLASKLCGLQSVAIVTDIPDYMQNYTEQQKSGIKRLVSNLYRILCNFFMYRYDAYIVLTEDMNKIVNLKNKPYVVIEGMVDINMRNMPNVLQNKYEKKTIIYAGALREKYGVRKLIEAFMELKSNDIELWLYGSGELENDIKDYEQKDNRIKYFGVVSNEIVVKEQLKATLLVNPRPSQEEFTRYSFPSKNMEYMVSGTPVLTTPLQGMPKEYNDYVYLFEDETTDGMVTTLKYVLGKSKEELYEKGFKAKEFVLREKNNLVQANKILKMLKGMR